MVIRETPAKGQHSARQLWGYWINFPFPFDAEVYRNMYASLYREIQDLDMSRTRSYFDGLPELDYSSGGTTKAEALSAVIGAAMSRFHAAHWLYALASNTVIWSQLAGFQASSRITTHLRWGKINSLLRPLKGMPINPAWTEYLASQQRILVANQLHHGIGVSMPLYIPFHDNWITYSRGHLDDDGSTFDSARTVATAYPNRRIPVLQECYGTLSSFGSYEEATDGEGMPDMNGYDTTQGVLASYLYDRLVKVFNDIISNFTDMLDPTHPMREFLVKNFGCTGVFDTAEMSEKVRSIAPCDAHDFIQKYMLFGSEMQPFLHLEGHSDGYLGTAIPEEDTYTTPQALSLGDDPYTWYVTKARGQAQYLGMSATVDSTDQLDAIRAGTFSLLQQAITDMTKLTLLGATNTTPPTTWGSPDGGTNYPYDRGIRLLASVLDLAYSKRPGYFKTARGAQDLVDRFEEKGNKLFILPVELQAGKLILHSLFRPHINTWDMKQCGMMKVISHDDIVDDPWSKWLTAANNTRLDSIQSEDADTGIWESADTRGKAKDMLIYLGDAFMSSPNIFFTRRDLICIADASAHNIIGNLLPMKPFAANPGILRRAFNQYFSTPIAGVQFANLAFTSGDWLFTGTPWTTPAMNVSTTPDPALLHPWLHYTEARTLPLIHYGFWEWLEERYDEVQVMLKSLPSPAQISAAAGEITNATASLLDIEFIKRATGAKGDRDGTRGNRPSNGGRRRPRGRSRSKRTSELPPRADVSSRTPGSEIFKPDELSETTTGDKESVGS
jgi:hypothetical protein